MDTYIWDAEDVTKITEKIYNTLKDYCLTKDSARFIVGHVKFDDTGNDSWGCRFDVLSKYSQELLGKCEFSIGVCTQYGPSSGYMTVSFKTCQEDVDEIGNVYPKIILPPTRYVPLSDGLRGRYFYLLIDELYYMTSF